MERRKQDPAELQILELQINENDKAIQIFVQGNAILLSDLLWYTFSIFSKQKVRKLDVKLIGLDRQKMNSVDIYEM